MRPIPHPRHVALEDFRRYPGCQVMFRCEACGYAKGYHVLKVMARLGELRAGNSGTPVFTVARNMKRACPRCSERRWASQFAYPDELDEREWKKMVSRLRS